MKYPLKTRKKVVELNERLLEYYGPQGWWPVTREKGCPPVYFPGQEGRDVSDTDCFEIITGAILTQNTAWKNVEKALINLTGQDMLHIQTIAESRDELAAAIRPSGYFNQKAERLQNISRHIIHAGGIHALRAHPTDTLRKLLLSWKGIGPETADSILCYGFSRPVFVVDAYTKRMFIRLNLPSGSYDEMQSLVHQAITPCTSTYNDLHARIVKLYAAKNADAFLTNIKSL